MPSERRDGPASGGGPWGALALEPGGHRELEFGTLSLVIERSHKDVRLQPRRTTSPGHLRETPSDRWAVGPEAGLVLRPAVPDRLLVVSQEHPFYLPPNGEARVYVRIPLFVQVVLTAPRIAELVVVDAPSIVLSDTWWGTNEEGSLGYWLTTAARAEVTDDLFLPHMAMCPFTLTNRGVDALPVERFAVQVPHLSVFSTDGRNWTDEVRVRYQDSPEGSEIRFGGRAPEEARDAERVAGPRVATPKGFQARTFRRLRSLSGLGF